MRVHASWSSVLLLVACANEVATSRPPEGGAGSSPMAGSSGSGGAAGSTAALGGSSGGGAIVAGFAGMAAGTGGSSGGTSGTGGSSGGTSGTGGSAGSGGSGGSAGSGGSGGGTPVGELISVGKTATASSEETNNGNNITDGNDGMAATRWCAENGNADHWWAVDLGQSYTLTQIVVHWEKIGAYQYLIEGSADGSTWSPLIDNTENPPSFQIHTLPVEGEPEARHVRITVTGLPPSSWASFFEFSVYGL